MDELLLIGLRGRNMEGIIPFEELTPRPWAGAEVTATDVKAPNGDDCRVWSDTGTSCVCVDLNSSMKDQPYTIGLYCRPSSYQAQYGASPPQATAIQIGAFTDTRRQSATLLSGAGTNSGQPVTNGVATGTTVKYSNAPTPVGEWVHVAMTFDPVSKMFSGFFNGNRLGNMATLTPSGFMVYLGGLGDRAGSTGSLQTRYGFRGLMSSLRLQKKFQETNFNPLTW